MIPPASVRRYLGRQVHIYGRRCDDSGELPVLLSGRLEAIECGKEGCCLAIGDDACKGEPVLELIDLELVGSVLLAVQAERPLRAMDGGKVHRMAAEEPAPAPA